jgi:CubicO group peptidase (beta-lactamase class C family)
MNRTQRIVRESTLLAGALVLVLASARPVAAGPPAVPATGSQAPRLDPLVRALFDAGLAPGMQVAAVKDGQIVYQAAFGVADLETGRPVGPETGFCIGSTTKSFTAQAAASLAAKGTVDLDQPISKYLPALKLKSPLSSDSISLRDLLTHTHGISNDGPATFVTAFSGDYEPSQLPRLVAEHGPAEKGREFQYGNIGYVVAGMVLETVTGKSWKELVETEVLVPAKMIHTTAYRSRAGDDLAMPHRINVEGFRRLPAMKIDATLHAAGGHFSTATDLARFLEAHLGGGRIEGQPVFSAALIQETHRKQATQDKEFGVYHRDGWGLGWDLGTYESDRLTHRFGTFPGYFSHISFMPERGVGVVVLVNDNAVGGKLVEWVANAIYDTLLDKPGATEKWQKVAAQGPELLTMVRTDLRKERERRAARPQETAHPLSAYAGEYANPFYGRMSWTLEGTAPRRLKVRMGALASDTEVYDGAKDQIRVELTGTGEVVAFECEGEKAAAVRYDGVRFERR